MYDRCLLNLAYLCYSRPSDVIDILQIHLRVTWHLCAKLFSFSLLSMDRKTANNSFSFLRSPLKFSLYLYCFVFCDSHSDAATGWDRKAQETSLKYRSSRQEVPHAMQGHMKSLRVVRRQNIEGGDSIRPEHHWSFQGKGPKGQG